MKLLPLSVRAGLMIFVLVSPACSSLDEPGSPVDLAGQWEYGPNAYSDERLRQGVLWAKMAINMEDGKESGRGEIRETFPSATGRYRRFDYLEVEQRFPDVKIYLGGPKPGAGVYEAKLIEESPGEYAMVGRFRYDVFDLTLTFRRRR